MVDAGNGGSDGDAVEAPVGPRVAAGTGDAGGRDGDEVVSGAGLMADAQATTRRPTAIVVAARESDERIRCPPDGV
jgi:hypothetical protein